MSYTNVWHHEVTPFQNIIQHFSALIIIYIFSDKHHPVSIHIELHQCPSFYHSSCTPPQLFKYIYLEGKKKSFTVIYPSFSIKIAICKASSSSISVYLNGKGNLVNMKNWKNLTKTKLGKKEGVGIVLTDN